MASGPTQISNARAQEAWAARPFAAGVIRTSILVAPIVVSLAVGFWASAKWPPETLRMNRWLWWIGLMVVATIVVRLLDVALRRLGPVAMLFKLSLVFPDQTPKRFKSALRGGTVTATKRRIREIQEGGGALEGDDAISAQMLDLIAMLSQHDRMTRGHAERVRGYTELIAKEMGIGGGSLERLRWAALLHDMGKLEVPSEILNKDGRPTDEEWAILSAHPAAAERHLAPIADWLGDWRHAADGHHEKWDGSGYPKGLAGTDIPLSARIVAVADAYDVMTSTRSYKKPMPAEVARREISDNAGTQFDPTVARAFLAIGLGDLRRVGGPVAWFASLPAVRQVPIGSVAQPIATGIVATATTVSAAVVNLPEEPVREPPVIAFADEATTTTLPPPTETVIVVPTTSAPAAPAPAAPPTTTAPPPVNQRPVMAVQTVRLPETTPTGPTGQRIVAEDTDGPSPLTFSVASGDHPFEIDGTTGELVIRDGGVLDRESYLVVVTTSDGEDETTTLHTVVVTATDNGSPTISDRTAIVAEDAAIGSNVVAIPASDPDDDPLEFAILSDEVPFAIDAGGSISVAGVLDHEADATHVFPVQARDPDGNVATATVEVIVADVNEPPASGTLFQEVAEGETIVVDVATTHPDPEGTTVTLRSIVADGSHGTTNIVGPSRLSYTHDGGETLADQVRYDVVDESGLVGTGTLSLTVQPVNDPPNAATITFTVDEGDTGQILVFEDHIDPEGGRVTVASIDSTTNGTATLAAPDRIRFEHDGSDTTAAAVSYTVTDPEGNTALGTANIAVTPVNDAPQMSDQTISISETAGNGSTGASVDADDPDGPVPLEFAFTTSGGPFSLTPAGEIVVDDQTLLDHETTPSYTIGLSATDGEFGALANLTILVTDVNEPVTASGGSTSIPENYTSFDPVFIGTYDDPENDVTGFELLDATNPDADGDGSRAFRILDGLNPGEYRILRWDGGELDFGDNGQTFNLGVRLTDAGGLTADTTVTITITSRFELSPFHGDVIISEVNWSQHEAIELHNTTGAAIDVANWTIRDTELGETEANMINGGAIAPGGTFEIDPDDEGVVWVAAAAEPLNHAEDGGVSPGVPEIWLNEAWDRLTGVDDLYLYDADDRLVAYMAWGDVDCVGCLNPPEIGDQPPVTAWNLWESSAQIPLGTGPDVDEGQSISLANYDSPNLSACWEPTTADTAGCVGAERSQDRDDRVDGAAQVNSFGTHNLNQAPEGAGQSFQASETAGAGTLVGSFTVSDPENDTITPNIRATTNPNLDGDATRAYTAVVVGGTTVEIRISDPDDVDHGVAGQTPTLEVELDDGNGNTGLVLVSVATQTRFGLSPHFGEVIISEVDWATQTAEFVELVNVSGGQVDMANWTISDYAVGIDPADGTGFVGTIPNTVTALDPGQRVLFWPGTSPDPQTAGVEFEGNQGDALLEGSDDVWLLDENGRIVAYVAWGDDSIQDADNEIGDRPPIVAWNLWDPTHEAALGSGPDVTSGQSISVAIESAAAAQNSACWEPTTSGDAAARCAGANLTQNLDPGADDNPNRISSPGRPNY